MKQLTKEIAKKLEAGTPILLKDDTMYEFVLFSYYDEKNNEPYVVEYLTKEGDPSIYCPELEELYIKSDVEKMCIDSVTEFIGR